MSLIRHVRRKRVIPWLGAYLAGGFLALEGVDQLIGNGLLPELVYPVALTFYLFGIPGAIVLAWYHGEHGPQKPPRGEMWLQGAILAGALITSGLLIRDHQREEAAAAELASAGLDPRDVAVLYFEDVGSEGELAYVADGITEALIDQLHEVRALDVVSRNGVLPFRGSSLPLDSVARLLESGTLVLGSVAEEGDRVRISARLVDGFSGADLDRLPTVELARAEVFAAQDSVAVLVSRALRGRIGEEVELRQRRVGTTVAEAWTLAQRASRLQSEAEGHYDAGDLADAIERLVQADELLIGAANADPMWAEPLVMRAHNSFRWARITLDAEGGHAADELIETGLGHAGRALAVAPGSARALEKRGTLRYLRWLLDLSPDAAFMAQLLADARSDLEGAVQADPTLATAHATLSHLYYQTKDLVDVVLAARRAYEEDAYLGDADLMLSRLFWGHYDLGQFNDARQWCEEGASRFHDNPMFTECRLWLLLAPTIDPDADRAWVLQARLDSLTSEDLRPFYSSLGRMIVGGVLGRAGLLDSANNVLVGARASAAVDPEQETVGYEAVMRSVMGDEEGAIRLLQRYVAANPHHSFEAGGNLHWWWRNLRDHPGFRAVAAAH